MRKIYLLPAIFISCCLVVSFVWTKPFQSDSSPSQKELYILAAASLTDVMKEAEQQFEASNPTINLTFSFASSGKLQKQIEQGAPGDLFLSAGMQQMKILTQKDLVESSTLLLKNDIVLIRKKGNSSIQNVEDLTRSDITHLSIGQPDTVPAGDYAKQVLQRKGLWTDLENKIVYANDVRQILEYVQTGNVEAGLVYTTDVSNKAEVEPVQTFDSKSHSPINYPVAILKDTEELAKAKLLFDWLQGTEAKQIFESYGFKMYR